MALRRNVEIAAIICQAGIALLDRAMQYAGQARTACPKAGGLYSRRIWDNMQS
ncbi:hypothetical protein [Profundibacter sp.]